MNIKVRPLTKRQKQFLRAVESLSRKNKYPPTLRQIAEAMGIDHAGGVRQHATLIERKGFLRIVDGRIILAGKCQYCGHE